MIVSSAFNRKFHATLGDIVSSGKMITISDNTNAVIIDTKKIDIEGIKILFKILDSSYPISSNYPSIKKTIVAKTKLEKLYDIYGYPKSITDLIPKELTEHLEWIQFVCAENNIALHDEQWELLLE